MWQLGYAQCSAVSRTQGKYVQVVGSLWQEHVVLLGELVAQSASSYRFAAAKPLLVVVCDGLAFSLCWHSAVRANNAGTLRVQAVHDQQGHPLLEQLLLSTFPCGIGATALHLTGQQRYRRHRRRLLSMLWPRLRPSLHFSK
jgi:hypothetical protein